MKNRTVLFIIMICSLAGCQGPKTSEAIETVKVDLSKDEIKTSELFANVELVKLETNDNSLLGTISKSYPGDSLIFIKCAHELFLFDRNGVFIRKISNIGNGPEEYTRLSDFDVDEGMKEILVLDKSQQKVLVYNYQGEYLRAYPVGFQAIKLINAGDNEHYLYSGNEAAPSNEYKINRMRATSLSDSLFPIDKRKKNYLHINSAQNFYWNSGDIYFFEAFNDTIYNLTRGVPQYYICYSNATPDSFFDRDFQNIMSFFQEFNKAGYANSTHNAFESSDRLFFSCYHGGTKYFNVYNKESKSCSSYNTIIDDVLFVRYELPFGNDDFEFWVTRKNEIAYTISAQQLKENAESIKDEKLRQSIAALNEDDNPVVILCEIK